MVRRCLPIPQKIYKTKRLKTPEDLEKYFPGLLAFTDCTEQQILRPIDKNRRKIFYSGKKKEYCKELFMVILFIKKPIKKEENMIIYSIYKKNHPVTPKEVVNVFDLGFLGVEKES